MRDSQEPLKQPLNMDSHSDAKTNAFTDILLYFLADDVKTGLIDFIA